MYAWIEQILIFDSPAEVAAYRKDLDRAGVHYSIIEQTGNRLRIRKQYNKNELLERG
jgi:hypothetical protein